MSHRPQPHIPLSSYDRTLEILAWLLLLATALVPVVYWQEIPERIPMHFGVDGTPDRWANKREVWIVPAIAAILHIGLWWLNRYPHLFNYPVKITEVNARSQYALATRLMRIIMVGVNLLFLYIVVVSLRVAWGRQSEAGWALVLLIFLLLMAIMVWYWRKLRSRR